MWFSLGLCLFDLVGGWKYNDMLPEQNLERRKRWATGDVIDLDIDFPIQRLNSSIWKSGWDEA